MLRCLKLSETVTDQHLADRMKAMAGDLLEKAREADDRNPNDWKTDTPNGVGLGQRNSRLHLARHQEHSDIGGKHK
jgi:hypothetical protein